MKINEIDFCDYFRENLVGKSSANFETINRASKLIGRSEHATCPSCAKSEYHELLNVYNRLLPAYMEYLQTKVETPIETIPEPLPDVYTKFETIEEQIVVKPKKSLK